MEPWQSRDSLHNVLPWQHDLKARLNVVTQKLNRVSSASAFTETCCHKLAACTGSAHQGCSQHGRFRKLGSVNHNELGQLGSVDEYLLGAQSLIQALLCAGAS